MSSTIEVGLFAYDPETSTLTGPERYMQAQGNEKLAAFLAGADPGFNAIMQCAPLDQDPIRTVLVALQTDYAGWHGMESLLAQTGLAAARS